MTQLGLTPPEPKYNKCTPADFTLSGQEENQTVTLSETEASIENLQQLLNSAEELKQEILACGIGIGPGPK